jgi:hypothetical protein
MSEHITEGMDAFPEQLQRPYLVEPQIVLRSKDAHNGAYDKGSDCHPQHERMELLVLFRTSYCHTIAVGLRLCRCGAGALVGLAYLDHIANEIPQIQFCVCCGKRFVADEDCFDDLLT